ncbi:class II fructose-bisphosphate aldolase [Gemella sp. zg-570]|uniref:class II fructose-bisphosphate aldolase n=1 Tax=Gemella sp. zg-570 TaxID=2840371 RepID=UPI001C0E5CBA|nr:class II fructose-bisphosphate aldolase [Gemella sp. zg-570]QWQ38941.1 class II fructose-bisphosphate aldolase [Gemella sp. zg-570]
MTLINVKKAFNHADKYNYAIPAANFINQEMLEAYIAAAEETNKPLIIAFAEAHSEYISMEKAALLGKFYAENSKAKIILHLDHGQSLASVKKAIDLGFTSVMIDASEKEFAENVRITKEVVDYAHSKGIFVEAEIGHVGSGDVIGVECAVGSDGNVYTSVEEAREFVKQTDVDSLAISIGTSHGTYVGEPNISIERLKEIDAAIDTPLVLHGGSSSGDENLNNCATNGIRKINIYTDFLKAAHKSVVNSKSNNYYEHKEEVKEAIKNTLLHYFNVFETKGE